MPYLQAYIHKTIKTTGGLLERLLPKSIHAIAAIHTGRFDGLYVYFIFCLKMKYNGRVHYVGH